MESSDPLRHHTHYQQDDSPYAGGSSFMERVSEGVASGMGTVGFLLISSAGAVAFYTGALVIIAQKAQTRTDKANEEAAAKHREELAQYQSQLLEKNTQLTQQIHTPTEQLNKLTQEVHRATCNPLPKGDTNVPPDPR